MTIRGRDNRAFREKMVEVRSILKNAQKLLAEIEPLVLPRQTTAEVSA